MVRRYFLFGIVCMLALTGCVSVQMPQYLKDKNPYHQEFYTSYDKALNATTSALEKLGWKIVKQANPVVFENDSASSEAQPQQIILFTNVRQTSMLLASRYTTLNVLVKENNEKVEVEIRYYSVLSTLLWKPESYKNNGLVNKIFDEISKLLSSTQS